MKEHFQPLVEELLLLLGDDGADSTQPYRVDEAHPVELHLVLAAPGAKDSTATPTVVLENAQEECSTL